VYNRSAIMIAVASGLVGLSVCGDLAQAQYYSSPSLDPYHQPYGGRYPKEPQIQLSNLDAQLRTQTNVENTETAGVTLSQEPEYAADQDQSKELPPHLRRQIVDYWTKEPAGTIIIDTPNTYLYLVLGTGKAMRYGVGVGREGFTWAGQQRISRVAEWPDWTPPKEMIERQPYLPRFMAGGPTNPMGARALYLGSTVYRIHGTNQPSSIGTFVSSGCIRLTNADIEDLYSRVTVGTRVIVLPLPPTASASSPPARSIN
jgi:lipoprotein-anchoring transpeptidase ErfK/SrfK